MSFANYKRSRTNLVEKLVQEGKKESSGRQNYGDDRVWKPTVDKSGNGYAVLRFLPSKDAKDVPWAKYWDHGFQGPTGQWYIEKSRTSINEPDPASEYNSELWNSGIESDKDIVRKQKRRLHYVSNIVVVSDPGNPDNEGKVFLYQYGKKIFDKIMDAMQPEFQDEEPVNVFDFWEGADFKLKIRQVEGYRNYDKSEFASPAAFSEDDAEIEKVYNQMYDLGEFTDPTSYKSYDELKKRLYTVLQLDGGGRGSEMSDPRKEPEVREEAPSAGREDEAQLKAPVDVSESDDAGDDLSYFEKLAAED